MNASTLDMLPMKPPAVAKDKEVGGDVETGAGLGLDGSGVPFSQVLGRQLGAGKTADPEASRPTAAPAAPPTTAPVALPTTGPGALPTTAPAAGQANVPPAAPGAPQGAGAEAAPPAPAALQTTLAGSGAPFSDSPQAPNGANVGSGPNAAPGTAVPAAPAIPKNVVASGLGAEYGAGEPDLPQTAAGKGPAMPAHYAAEARARLAAQWRDGAPHGAPTGAKEADTAAAAGKPGPGDPPEPSLGLRLADLGSLAAGLRLESMSAPVAGSASGQGSGGAEGAGVETADVGRQVAEALARQIGPTTRGGALRLALSPEHLGRVEMEFRRDGGTLRVTLHAETAAAAAALEDGADELVDSLLGRGGAWQHVAVRVTCSETDEAEAEHARDEGGQPSDRGEGDGREGGRDEDRDAEEGAGR